MPLNVLAPWAEPVPGQRGLLTADELAHLPDGPWNYELVEGRLVRMPLAGTDHGGIAADLLLELGIFVRANARGRVFTAETGFMLSEPGQPDTVLGADAAFVRADRLPHRSKEDRHGFWRLAPDLVAEVASPDQFRPEMAAKARAWLAAGVHLVWVVWPCREQVDVWRGD
ncbi:MAG TPA: Uma2 family endonuclease, partial [Chloroflexota bacterium]